MERPADLYRRAGEIIARVFRQPPVYDLPGTFEGHRMRSGHQGAISFTVADSYRKFEQLFGRKPQDSDPFLCLGRCVTCGQLVRL